MTNYATTKHLIDAFDLQSRRCQNTRSVNRPRPLVSRIMVVNRLFFAILILGIWAFSQLHAEPISESLMENGRQGGWHPFGYAASSARADLETRTLTADADWSRATWGMGLIYVLPASVNGKDLHAIRLQVKTTKGSATKIYGGIATLADASRELRRDHAITVTTEWQEVELPIDKMERSRPEVASPEFKQSDWDEIQTIKLLFTGPDSDDVQTDRIYIKNPELVYSTDELVCD